MTQLFGRFEVAANLTKNGFHRDLSYTVQFDTPLSGEVEAVLIQNIPSGMYMDFYQLQSLRTDSGLHVLLDSEVDLEAPAYESPGFLAFIYPQPDPSAPGHLTATVPVHGRYHRPAESGAGEIVELQHPKLLLKSDNCKIGKALQSSPPHKTVQAPCSVHNLSNCTWLDIENLQAPAVKLTLPVGDKSLTFLVCVGTLIITVLCNLILTVAIWKNALFDML
ncbi:phosphatidylinositol-glycan biosynthesis class X protein isoform X2 [Engraulis encrasicolus]